MGVPALGRRDDEVIRLSDHGYPEPHEPHPIPDDCQAGKTRQVCHAVRDCAVDVRAPVTPLVHGYGPYDDFC